MWVGVFAHTCTYTHSNTHSSIPRNTHTYTQYQKTLEKYQNDWARERDTILAERDQYMTECKRLMGKQPPEGEDGESVAELRARCDTLSSQLEVLGQELAKTRTSSQESKVLKVGRWVRG